MKSENDKSDDELEALMARRLGRGKRKYKGKLPIICCPCKKFGHISTRCLDREDNDERKERKYKGRRDDRDNKKNKDYKQKGKKYCYTIEEEIDTEFEGNDEEVVYVAIKEGFDEDEKNVLISYVNKSDR